MIGFLNLNKPQGLTSHDVVARVRRLAGRKVKVGHAGTLDPAATGVLPVALGAATRLIEYLSEARKGYRGVVQLGVTTTTDDAEGEILVTRPVPGFADQTIETAVAALRGPIMQVPPMYAALHHEGRRLYELAREGQQLDLPARPVQIHALTWAWLGPTQLELNVVCGKGTYIRSLARDLGAALGCGAHLASLARTFVGPFALTEALPLETLMAEPDRLPQLLLPPEVALADWPVVQLDEAAATRIRHGLPIDLPELPGEQARAHDPAGALIAVLQRQGSQWRPVKVLG
ncbi:MAG: tRNA pseudouridine(55) synthase TruB [Oscillochloridaceae bacterium umkhey_bin13]